MIRPLPRFPFARHLLVLVPALWVGWFSFVWILAAGVTLGACWLWERYRYRNQRSSLSENGLILDETQDFASSVLAATFATLLYIPLATLFQWGSVTVMAVGGIAFLFVWVEKDAEGESVCGTEGSAAPRHSPGNISARVVAAFLALPLFLGVGVVLALALSRENLPLELLPIEGLETAAGLSLLWYSVWWALRGNPPCPAIPEETRQAAETGVSTQPQLSSYRPLLPLRTCALVICLSVIGLAVRLFHLVEERRHLEVSQAGSVAWSQLIKETELLGWSWFEEAIRRAAVRSEAAKSDPKAWVDWVKGSRKDLTQEGYPSPFFKFLARGGAAFPKMETGDAHEAAALAVDLERRRIWVLSAGGLLLRIGNDIHPQVLHASLGPFVHCRIEPGGDPLVLESGGRLLRVRDEGVEEVCPTAETQQPIFRRLCMDPRSGQPWALDTYGNLYHSPGAAGWLRDERFTGISKEGNTVLYDIARSLAISAQGRIAVLDCYGQIWSASLDSPRVDGPLRESHYWPALPVGQSMGSSHEGWRLVDRYGGFYFSPYPRNSGILALRGTHLFPRSLARREPDIVDHAFLEDRRWVYLLTKSGKILTNKRWTRVWAE
jgi:hypothetical protein